MKERTRYQKSDLEYFEYNYYGWNSTEHVRVTSTSTGTGTLSRLAKHSLYTLYQKAYFMRFTLSEDKSKVPKKKQKPEKNSEE